MLAKLLLIQAAHPDLQELFLPETPAIPQAAAAEIKFRRLGPYLALCRLLLVHLEFNLLRNHGILFVALAHPMPPRTEVSPRPHQQAGMVLVIHRPAVAV